MAITITLKQAVKESGLSIRTLYCLIGDGKLKSVKVRRRRLVLVQSLTDLLTGRAPLGANKERASAEPQRRKAARGAK